PTVFEDVVKMLLTTNCTWANTSQMVRRILAELGELAPSGRRAFPAPQAMAAAGERFYRDVVRAGYRAPYLADIARRTASGELTLEPYRGASDSAADLRRKLLALPGIGPYAADNLLRLLGRYDYLGLDSWCRGKLKRLYPRSKVTDELVARRYRSFAPY